MMNEPLENKGRVGRPPKPEEQKRVDARIFCQKRHVEKLKEAVKPIIAQLESEE